MEWLYWSERGKRVGQSQFGLCLEQWRAISYRISTYSYGIRSEPVNLLCVKWALLDSLLFLSSGNWGIWKNRKSREKRNNYNKFTSTYAPLNSKSCLYFSPLASHPRKFFFSILLYMLSILLLRRIRFVLHAVSGSRARLIRNDIILLYAEILPCARLRRFYCFHCCHFIRRKCLFDSKLKAVIMLVI